MARNPDIVDEPHQHPHTLDRDAVEANLKDIEAALNIARRVTAAWDAADDAVHALRRHLDIVQPPPPLRRYFRRDAMGEWCKHLHRMGHRVMLVWKDTGAPMTEEEKDDLPLYGGDEPPTQRETVIIQARSFGAAPHEMKYGRLGGFTDPEAPCLGEASQAVAAQIAADHRITHVLAVVEERDPAGTRLRVRGYRYEAPALPEPELGPRLRCTMATFDGRFEVGCMVCTATPTDGPPEALGVVTSSTEDSFIVEWARTSTTAAWVPATSTYDRALARSWMAEHMAAQGPVPA